VDSDWNKATFDAVLKLLWDTIFLSCTENKKKLDWVAFLGESQDKKYPKLMPDEIVERLRDLSFIFREPYIPILPHDIDLGRPRTAIQTQAAICYLLFPTLVQLKGETGFFQDLQSLLYLNAVHYLLPHLEKLGLNAAHACLVNAMHIHAIVVWRDQPAHMFYLLSALMGQLGNKKARLRFLDSAVSATPIHDHSYLTKANAYWGELLELGEKDLAMDFLLKLSRYAPESYSDEISGMIKQTAEIEP
jgi:hypothetical protein